MTIDSTHQNRFPGLPYGNMPNANGYSSQSSAQTHFNNPWVTASSAPTSNSMYHTAQAAHGGMPPNPMGLDRHSQQQSSLPPVTTTGSLSAYGSVPATSAAAGSPISMVDPSLGAGSFVTGQSNLHLMPHEDLMMNSRMPHSTTAPYNDTVYHTAPPPVQPHATYAASPTGYEPNAMAFSPPNPVRSNNYLPPHEHADAQSRRYSHSSMSSSASYDPVAAAPRAPAPRDSFVDFSTSRGLNEDLRSYRETFASQGLLDMSAASQETPRADNRGRSEYGFPAPPHSNHSSISEPYSPYYSSVDDNYSTAGSDIESVQGSRTLPRPQGLSMAQQPPAPQTMMGQFSSRVQSSTSKKHKCKVCDKRFTRPSSLQTHLYSHTGEKRT